MNCNLYRVYGLPPEDRSTAAAIPGANRACVLVLYSASSDDIVSGCRDGSFLDVWRQREPETWRAGDMNRWAPADTAVRGLRRPV